MIGIQDKSVFLKYFDALYYIFAFLIVLFLVYFFTKLIAKKTGNLTKSNKIKVLDFLALSTDNKILIVEIIDNIYVLAVNKNQVTVVDKLNKNEVDITSLYNSNECNNSTKYFDICLKNTKKIKDIFHENIFKNSKKQENLANDTILRDAQKDKE